MSIFRRQHEPSTPAISVADAAKILQAQREDFSKQVESIEDVNTSMDWRDLLEAMQKRELINEQEAKEHFHAEKAFVMGIFALGGLIGVAMRAASSDFSGLMLGVWALFIGSFALIPEWVAYHIWIRRSRFLGKQKGIASAVLYLCMAFSIMGITSLIGMVRHNPFFADIYFQYINPAAIALIFIKDWVIQSLSPQAKMKRHLERELQRLQDIEMRANARVLDELERAYEAGAHQLLHERRVAIEQAEHADVEHENRRKELAQWFGNETIEALNPRELMMYQKALNDANVGGIIRQYRQTALNAESQQTHLVEQLNDAQRQLAEQHAQIALLSNQAVRRVHSDHATEHPENVHLTANPENVQTESVQIENVQSQSVQTENVQAENVQAENVQVYVKTCEWCGIEFNAKRSTARFCSDSHRVRASEAERARKQAKTAGKSLFDEIAVG